MPPSPAALEQAFLDDIVAHPDDPSLWLILADWLEERDDARAELVRLTWSLQYEPIHADFAARQTRVQALLAGGMVPVRPRCLLGDIEFAWIPSGSFLMGSPSEEPERSDDEVRHRVTLTAPFWMGVYPVTQAQWQAVTGRNPSSFSPQGPRSERIAALADAEIERQPVESLPWSAASEFCAQLSERLGRHIALPTEAQWEYACRAGTTTPFHFGHCLDGSLANCNGGIPYGTTTTGPSPNRPTPVGTSAYPPNAWGLYEMAGNVWEMCRDVYRSDYENLSALDPCYDPGTDEPRVLRGGSWGIRARWCRSTDRHNIISGAVSSGYGLRACCLD
jgi:uncharacterized protein (TIGR02996 family)